MGESYCAFPDCGEEAQRYGLCWGHVKQKQRGRPLTPLKEALSPEEAVLAAGNDWLEADENDEYRAARTRFLLAASRWLRSQGWKPPAPPKMKPCCSGLVQLTLPLKARRGSQSTTRARVEA